MFVKFYRYKIKSENFELWKDINDRTMKLFKTYGVISKRLFKEEGKFVHIIEMDHYKNENEYYVILKKVNKSEEGKALNLEFLNVIYRKHISEEDFETV